MMKLNNRGSWSLIGLLVAVVIVVLAVAYFYGGKGGPSTVERDSELLDPSTQKKTVVGASIDTAKAHVCLEQLTQIRQGIQAYKATAATEENPATLRDIGLSVGQDFYQCPVSGKQYTYNPATAEVKCPTHERY